MTKREILHESIKVFRISIKIAKEEKENNFKKTLRFRERIDNQIYLLNDIGVINCDKMFLLQDIIRKMIFD